LSSEGEKGSGLKRYGEGEGGRLRGWRGGGEGEGEEGRSALREKQGIWSLPQLCLAGNTEVALTKALYAFTYKTLLQVLGLKQKILVM
jgi:hypothetical protein